MENLSRQALRGAPTGQAATTSAGSTVDLAVVAQMQARLDAMSARLEDLAERFDSVESVARQAESKVSWRATIRLILVIVTSFVLGIAGASLAHLTGWIG